MCLISVAGVQTRVTPVSGCRRRIGTRVSGSTFGSGKTRTLCLDRLSGGSDRELITVASGGKASDDLAVLDRKWNSRCWATRTMGGTAAPGGSVRKVTDHGKPGSHGRFRAYETVTSGFGPGRMVAAVGSRSGRDRQDAVRRRSRCRP